MTPKSVYRLEEKAVRGHSIELGDWDLHQDWSPQEMILGEKRCSCRQAVRNISLDSLHGLKRRGGGQPRVTSVGFWWGVFLWLVTDIRNSGRLDGKTPRLSWERAKLRLHQNALPISNVTLDSPLRILMF